MTRNLTPATPRAWPSGAEIISADAPATPWTITHSRLFDDVLNPSGTDIRLVGATAAETSSIKDAVKLLRAVVPDLYAGILPHTSFVFLVDGTDAFESASDRRLPRAAYLNRDMAGDVVRTAEALLHESTHQKLYDLQLLYTIYGATYDPASAPTIRPPWHPPDTQWSIDRTTAASHVYVHLTYFLERLRESVPAGCDAEAVSRSATQARSRADSLLGALTPHHFTQFNAHGRAFLSWLRHAHHNISTILQEGTQ
ncbi:HEXXH motif-containing putative peptide modification protein [Rhodococcus ruber]|uniref:HEXXH motif-containing putative peptide modification protein n=1 Tax=Rhodococcus ruber TaxID=1830 RepID=A0ABT4MG31_9NOCA|nr:HEXXH motif-containing putative peptide modification protein [Rhodococcus ruber]MCZ4519385.1 HEXXH motif-containing putative peptide modification protein [Rhodococcus ruber]